MAASPVVVVVPAVVAAAAGGGGGEGIRGGRSGQGSVVVVQGPGACIPRLSVPPDYPERPFRSYNTNFI